MQDYERFEKEYERLMGVPNVVACSSGTAALHLALEALAIPQYSEVILPDFTMIACPRAVTLAGLKPVFVDVNDHLLMAPYLVWDAVTPLSRAIMAVHIYGRAAPMDEYFEVAANQNLFLIEDLAEAHGLPPHPSTDAACWSFYRNKIIAGEEGGAISFRSPKHAERARSLRSLGFTEEHDYRHAPRGHNYRMSNLHASAIMQSLSMFGRNVKDRNRIIGYYDELCPEKWKMPERSAPWVYDLRIRGMVEADQYHIVGELNRAGIAARHGFKPMHTQEEYWHDRLVKHRNGNVTWSYAKRLCQEVIYLPVIPGTTGRDVVSNTFRIINKLAGKLG